MPEDIQKAILSLPSNEKKVLGNIELGSAPAIAQKADLSEAEVMSALSGLEAKGYVTLQIQETKFVGLDVLGKQYLTQDLPEIVILKDIINGTKKMSELSIKGSEFSSALGILKREEFVIIEKQDELTFTITLKGKEYLSSFSNPLRLFTKNVPEASLTQEQEKIVRDFSNRRKFFRTIIQKSATATLTPKGIESVSIAKEFANVELTEALTTDMLKNQSWKQQQFRPYNVHITAPFHTIGRRHPMMEANNILRDVFVEMGFVEMQGPMVESAFWNMDTMWIPQDHPARDEQDTFYLDGAATIPPDLSEKTKEMHEKGIKRTHTNQGDWRKDIAQKRLLRTHSTATSFRMLAKLGEEFKKTGKPIPNSKYFYVANNFRNEAVDATHLAEFYQAEGFIIGDNLGLADLMGFVKEFYAKLGINKIRFKPTFNPYTEPSMEAHYYDEKMKKWYALINSGIFRQETLKPLGIDKTIIAWGMGASRVAALLTKAISMRDITGASCDFEWLKHRPLMSRTIVREK